MIKKAFFFVFVLALGLAAGVALYPRLVAQKPAAGAAGGQREAKAPQGQRKILYYVDPMHPAYKSDRPGIAPDCGMKLEPVYEGDRTGEAAEAMPPGAVKISPEKQQLIGVRFGEVRVLPLARTIRTVGKVTYDESKIARIHTKIEGWIEQVHVEFAGQFVQKGQPMFSIYSPELLATQQEFLLAAKARRYLSDSPIKEVAAGSESLYAAARKRLELWDISDAQIEEIARRNAPIKSLTVFSPITGYVLTKNAFPRQRITPDTEVYAIADLSTVWVLADVYEYEAPAIRIGQPARMTLSYSPGQAFRGRVTYIYPQVEAITRTLKVRLEFANPDLQLKPDMYVNVELASAYGRRLAVPEEAVLNSGMETTVFADRGNGYLEPRKVELGEKVDRYYIVLSGVKEGERVVTSGNFLVDSESRLKSAAAQMGAGHQHGGPPPAEAPAPAPRKPEAAPPPPSPPAARPHGGHRP